MNTFSVATALNLVMVLTLIPPSPVSRAEEEVYVGVDPLDVVHACGMKLLGLAGKKAGPEVNKLPALYTRASTSKDTEFLEYMLAVIFVESRFRKEAKSEKDAYGLMQMTEIAVIDASKHCNIKPVSMSTLFDSYTNIKYGTCYLRKALEYANGDWNKALIIYNGGFLQLTKYIKGESMATETANYVLQVNRALGICRAPQETH